MWHYSGSWAGRDVEFALGLAPASLSEHVLLLVVFEQPELLERSTFAWGQDYPCPGYANYAGKRWEMRRYTNATTPACLCCTCCAC